MGASSTALGDLVQIVGGGTPDRKNPQFWGGEIPWASVKDLTTHELTHTQETITSAGLENSAANLVSAGTVLVATRMAVGRCALTAMPVAINQDLKALEPSPKLDPRYLLWFLLQAKSSLERQATGATVKGIRLETLASLRIPLPSLPEQRQIAAILDKADAVRRKRQQTLDLADQFLRSAFLDMFGDPVTNPKGWPVRRLGDCLARKPQIGTIAKADASGAVAVVRVGDLGTPWLSRSVPTRIMLAQSEIERYRIEPGDFLLARAIGSEAHLGKASVVPANALSEGDVVFDSHVMRLRLDEPKLSHVFLWHWLKSPGGRAMFMRNAGRTAVQFNINAAQIARVPIPVPPGALQARFAEMARVVGGAVVAAATATCQCEKLLGAVSYRAFRAEL
jgi:type I restriction enzyme S subunit